MGDAAKVDNGDDKMIVQLTVGQIRGLLRDVVREELHGAAKPRDVPFVDVTEAARHFNVDPRTVRNWIGAGAPAMQAGRDYRIRLADLEQWVTAQGTRKHAVGTRKLAKAK